MMAHFEVTVRLFDVSAANLSEAGRGVESRLRAAGFGRWQILKAGLQAPITQPVRVPVARRTLQTHTSYVGGGLLVVASAVWALWFLYLIAR
jgi:hypothetical protein